MPAVTFVINGTLASTSSRFPPLCRAIAAHGGWTTEFVVTDKASAGIAAARDAVACGADLVVAAGGDGTVRSCAEGLADTDVPLGIVPLGTANLLARTLGVPAQTRAALTVALDAHDAEARRLGGDLEDDGRWIWIGFDVQFGERNEAAADENQKAQ